MRFEKRPLKFSSRSPALCCVFVCNIPFRFNFIPAGYFLLLRLRLLHFLFRCHVFSTFPSADNHCAEVACEWTSIISVKAKQNKQKKKIAISLPKCSKNTSDLTLLDHCGSELVQFRSSSLNLYHPVSCHAAVLPPHLFSFAACGPKLTFKATCTSKRTLFLFNAFQKRKKEKALCKWSSFILSLLFSPRLIPLQTKSDRKHDAALRKTFAVCMSSSCQGSVERALWRKSRLTKYFGWFVFFPAGIYHPPLDWLSVFVVTNQEWRELPQFKSTAKRWEKKK